jgi:hypothetical protein
MDIIPVTKESCGVFVGLFIFPQPQSDLLYEHAKKYYLKETNDHIAVWEGEN